LVALLNPSATVSHLSVKLAYMANNIEIAPLKIAPVEYLTLYT
jgi:hypothetical protein